MNILFDLDGTLTDPKVGITKSVAHALNHFGIEVNDLDSLCKFIGPSLGYSFSTFYGFDKAKCEKAIEVYREYFSVTGKFENEVYGGIPEMLRILKDDGHRLFVATSKPEVFAKDILCHFGLDKYFERICGIPLDGEGMTKAQVIECVITEYSLDKAECIMVGDRCYDAKGAHQNGIPCIGVLYGYGDREEFEEEKTEYITPTVKTLTALLKKGKA